MRRIHVTRLFTGEVPLDPRQLHHIVHVLRLGSGAAVEVFDDSGRTASGILVESDKSFFVRVDQVQDRSTQKLQLIVASAIPKGDRGDWMVEKLSEIGVDRFIPLITDRSVVLPSGTNKTDRWNRLAIEAAKQSKREGMMEIASLTELHTVVEQASENGLFFSTRPDAAPVRDISIKPAADCYLLIGPEGGWTETELASMESGGLTAVSLGKNILRIETAAVAASAIVQSLLML